jgi:hypothetical protein
MRKYKEAAEVMGASSGNTSYRGSGEMLIMFLDAQDENGFFTVAGFGSLLSPRSALTTFPQMKNFRVAKVMPRPGFEHVHTASACTCLSLAWKTPDSGLICLGSFNMDVVYWVEMYPSHPGGGSIESRALCVQA